MKMGIVTVHIAENTIHTLSNNAGNKMHEVTVHMAENTICT